MARGWHYAFDSALVTNPACSKRNVAGMHKKVSGVTGGNVQICRFMYKIDMVFPVAKPMGETILD